MVNLERDIELVLITGAGASREFGVGGQKLPLMTDWSNHLVQELAKGSAHMEITGLRRDMAGAEFESQLGSFLNSVGAFRSVKHLVEVTTELPNMPAGLQPQGVMMQWYQQVMFQCDQVIETIHKTLYEQFFESSVDTQAATRAFSWLFQVLELTPGTPFVFATTNYDIIATRVLADLGFKPDWGPLPRVTAGSGDSDLHVEDLLGEMPRFTPVLHLHGKAGWYAQEGRGSSQIDNTTYSPQFGTPIVMLPDPDKDYGANAIINQLWVQFRLALARAKRVLVLGHSLHDPFLVRTLRAEVHPVSRLAVTTFGVEAPSPHAGDMTVSQIADQDLPGAVKIPVRFGTSEDGGRELKAWMDAEDIGSN